MFRSRRAASARALALAAIPLTILIGAIAAACNDGDKQDATPAAGTAVTTPGPSPTPTPAPADPDLGDTLRYEGEYERAIDVYAAVAADKDGDERQRALLNQAQLLVEQQRFAEARAALEAYLAGAAAPADGHAASYMLASVLDDLGDPAASLARYESYIAAGGTLTPFARIERAKLLARLGRAAEAAPAAEDVLADGLILDEFKASFALSMGRALEDGGAPAEALAWYARVRPLGGDAATALVRSGAIRRQLGDPAWIDDYLAVVASYPGGGAALDVLAQLDEAAVPVGDYARGVVEYRAARNEAARATLTRAAAAGDRPAEATYYLAALDERAGDADSAIDRYQQAYELDPASPLADDALWWRARLLQIAARYDEAAAVYATLAADFPNSQWAADARFHRGMVLYRAGDYNGAAFAWGAIAPDADGDERARALFWQARAEMAAGTTEGEQALAALVDEMPGNFYALRAEVLLGENDSKSRKPDLKQRDTDWDDIAAYLEQNAGVDAAALASAADDPRYTLAAELDVVGLHAQADAMFRAIIGDRDEDEAALYALAKRFQEEGRTSLAARAAATLIGQLEDAPEAPPDDLYRVAYPLAFGDLAQDAAEDEQISPLLLLALVRQESFYDHRAGSTAGALGLTQVIEPTGESIAATLGVEPFTVRDLFRPRLSLRFGASYLSDQLAAFDGNEYHALAAYNGGPGTAAGADDSSGGDIDLFVEDLEFDETRLYVRRVTENYARYRMLYGGVDRPSLPR